MGHGGTKGGGIFLRGGGYDELSFTGATCNTVEPVYSGPLSLDPNVIMIPTVYLYSNHYRQASNIIITYWRSFPECSKLEIACCGSVVICNGLRRRAMVSLLLKRCSSGP